MEHQQLPDILFEAAGAAANAAVNAPHPPPPDADGISPAALTQRSLRMVMDDKQHLTWSRVALPLGCVLPPRRSGAASVVVKGKLYMFGVSWSLMEMRRNMYVV